MYYITLFIYFYQKNQILIITSISDTLTKELEIMSLTEISRDDAVQPSSSTPTSSGTLPPPPPPPRFHLIDVSQPPWECRGREEKKLRQYCTRGETK